MTEADDARDGQRGLDAAVARLLAVIEGSRPAAVAGWPAFWADLAGLPVETVAAALERLVARDVVRRVPLAGGYLYIADPPHARPAAPE